MNKKTIKAFGHEYPVAEVKTTGIIDFNEQNFSAEEQEQYRKIVMPIPGQIMMIQGTQCVHCGAEIPHNGRCTKCAGRVGTGKPP